MGTYEIRNTDYQKAHGFTEEMLKTFVATFKIKEGDSFIDLMSGKGVICQQARLMYSNKFFSYTLLDAHASQLPALSEQHITEQDIRLADLTEGSYDIAALKFGIHEIKKHQQEQVFRNIHHILRPGGRLCLWELACKTPATRDQFRAVVNKKDELAGFTDFVENRYFNSLAELLAIVHNAGFENIGVEEDMQFTINTKLWLKNDLRNDSSKLQALNTYVRKNFDFEDHETHLTKKFYWPVITAEKI